MNDARQLPSLPPGPHELLIPYDGKKSLRTHRQWLQQNQPIRSHIGPFLLSAWLIFYFYFALPNHIILPAFVFPLGCMILAAVCYAGLTLLGSPTNLQLGKEGIRFHWLSNSTCISSPWLSWNSIEAVEISQVSGSNSIDFKLKAETIPISHRLFFASQFPSLRAFHAGRLQVDTSAITGDADIPAIVESIKYFAESAHLAPELSALAEQGDNSSYTRMWLDGLGEHSGAGADSQSLSRDTQPLTSGTLVGEGYEIVERLAAGGQAMTYLAKPTNTQNNGQGLVVIKEIILPVHGGIDIRRRSMENAEREAKLLRRLDHPRIVKMLESFTDSLRAYLVLEHIDGESLRKLIQKNGPLPEQQVHNLALQMCEILEYLHSQTPPVVHLDFTPDNLLLKKEDSSLVLIDFNVAEQLDTIETKAVVGKHCYIPPEQFQGHPVGQSDIYACGCTIYWLLTGEDPIPLTVANARALQADISPHLNDIIARATSQEISNRFTSATEMKGAIKEYERQ